MASPEELDAIVKGINSTVQLRPESRQVGPFQTFAELKRFFEKERDFWSPKGPQDTSAAPSPRL